MVKEQTYWFTMPNQQAWLVVPVEGRKLVILMMFDTIGNASLKVVGYHMGSVKWLGEKQDTMAILIEKIPESIHNEILPKIHNALSQEFKDTKILFIDDKYLTRN
jgi:hypothetical protein